MVLLTLSEKNNVVYSVFRVPKGLLNVLTKPIHCVGNVLFVNLATWFINHSFAEMQ